ncbi:MAG: hypothetical protein HW386_1462 [Gammaproteobacteria bacterium]|nr:hypothetical protein [Gammaproteobacteria bacterium]
MITSGRRIEILLAVIAVFGLLFLTGYTVVAAAENDIADIGGAWQRYGIMFNAANMATGDKNIPPPVSDPPLKAEFLREWQAQRQARRDADAAGTPIANPNYVNCIGDGMPTMMVAMFPIEFLLSDGQITIIEEAYTQVRRVYLDQQQVTLDDIEPGFFGHSVGYWKEGVLHVDTIGIKDYVQFQYTPHSRDMRINERFYKVAPDILWDEITITDPEYLTQPWVFTYAYKHMPGYKMQEYICEANREYVDEHGYQQIKIGE